MLSFGRVNLLTMGQILFILTNALCAAIFAIAYPETKGNRPAPHSTIRIIYR